MIESIDTLAQMEMFPQNALSCRIRSTALAYGMERPFARYWRQGECALLCLLDNTLIVEADKSADYDELMEFSALTGAEMLLCSGAIAPYFGFPVLRTGRFMERRSAVASIPEGFERDPSPRKLHALLALCENPEFIVPDFEPFYLDLSHRTRHGTAASVGIPLEGRELAACAICSSFTQEDAILSAVAVAPVLRRQGLGRNAVRALLSLLPQRKAYILRAQEENEAFYRSLGFTDCGSFCELALSRKEFTQ